MKRIFWVESDGRYVGQCDQRCYHSQAKHAACMCGGINWRLGYKKAWNKTKEEMVRIYRRVSEYFENVIMHWDDGSWFDGETYFDNTHNMLSNVVKGGEENDGCRQSAGSQESV